MIVTTDNNLTIPGSAPTNITVSQNLETNHTMIVIGVLSIVQGVVFTVKQGATVRVINN